MNLTAALVSQLNFHNPVWTTTRVFAGVLAAGGTPSRFARLELDDFYTAIGVAYRLFAAIQINHDPVHQVLVERTFARAADPSPPTHGPGHFQWPACAGPTS